MLKILNKYYFNIFLIKKYFYKNIMHGINFSWSNRILLKIKYIKITLIKIKIRSHLPFSKKKRKKSKTERIFEVVIPNMDINFIFIMIKFNILHNDAVCI
jgi:hypothetical protein